MESIFKKPNLKAQSNRNAFAIGETRVFHAPFGAIIPFEAFRLKPNDYVEIVPENKTIIEPLMSPAFIRLKEHIDYYAVPYSQLWKPFDNFITQQDSYNSMAVKNGQGGVIPPNVPTMDGQFIGKMLRKLSEEKDEHGFEYMFGGIRLLDGLGYGNFYGMMQDFDQPMSSEEETPLDGCYGRVNPFALMAYQKIYYDYFRNTKYEECDTRAYNIDDINYSRDLSINTATADFERFAPMFKMRYRWMKKDYFTSIQPNVLPDSTQIGYHGMRDIKFDSNDDTTRAEGMNFGVPGADGGFMSWRNIDSYNENYNGGTFVTQNTDDQIPQSVSPTPARLRLMFAYDKLLRRMREAGGSYDAQMQAIFGIVPNMGREGKCYYIGGQTNRLYTKTITNQSETGEYGLGSMGGQVESYNQGRRKLKFHAKEECIVIGLYSTSIDNMYPSFMVDRMNTACGRFDWFNPYMEMLGSQTIMRQELNFLQNGENPYDMVTSDMLKDVLGYQRRYAEYKVGIDKAMGLFASKYINAEYATWVAKWTPRFFGRSASDWEAHERDIAPLDIRSMTYNPASLDEITKVPYNGNPNTDIFKIFLNSRIKKISNMSVIGENF